MTILQRFLALGVLVFFSSSFSAMGASTIEVVQSVPLETTLQVPGIRLTQQVWLDLINGAKQSIDLEQFYINNQAGQTLEPVMNALRAAAARGVHVRMLMDANYYKNYPTEPDAFSLLPNVEVKTISFASLGGIQHAKYIIADQMDLYEGSANFDWLALSHIHEVGLHINDLQIGANLESVFAKDWLVGITLGKPTTVTQMLPLKHSDAPASTPGMQLIASPTSDLPAGISDSIDSITQLLGSAQSTIRVQVYQYTTKGASSGNWTTLDTALRAAAARGVKVQLMTDAVAVKTGGIDLSALAKVANVSVKTVLIPQWSGGPLQYARLIHSKYFTVDGSSTWIGTENWSESYFTGCRNVGIILQSTAFAQQVNQIYDQVWNSAYTTAL